MVRLGKNARSGAHSWFDSFIRGQRNSWDQQQRWQGLVIYNTIKEPRWRLSMWEGVWSLGLGLGSPSRKEAVRLPLWMTTKGTVMAATTGKSLSFSFVCVWSDVERMRTWGVSLNHFPSFCSWTASQLLFPLVRAIQEDVQGAFGAVKVLKLPSSLILF